MPQLQVRFAEDFDASQSALPPGANPRLLWTLREYFEQWFLPMVLKPDKAAQGTIDRYRELLRYWEAITGDPTLLDLLGNDHLTVRFTDELAAWGYSRRGVKKGMKVPIGRLDKHPGYSLLRSATVAEHVSRLATLLKHAGPRQDIRSPAAEILSRFAYVPLVPSTADEKPPFHLDDAKRIARACALMDRPATSIPTDLWWETRIAIFYYTGLRAGSVVRLEWCHHAVESKEHWFKIPGAIVKTGKPLNIALHDELVERLLKVRGLARPPASGLILEPGCGYRQFLDLHAELQARAGIPRERQQSPHAWRRTHATEIATLGAKRGLKAAQEALDHDDERTTQQSYLHDALNNQLRLELPPLWRTQGRLF